MPVFAAAAAETLADKRYPGSSERDRTQDRRTPHSAPTDRVPSRMKRPLAILVFALLPAAATAQDRPADRVQPSRSPDVGFAPTTMPVAGAMLEIARVGPDDIVYDLGSGDGRIAIMAAEKYGASAVGVELQPHLVAASRAAAIRAGVAGRVTFIEADLFTADISSATVVTLYLWPSVNSRLESKLRNELRPGTRIVSNSFGIGRWTPRETVRTEDGTVLLLWTVPRRPSRTPDVPFLPTPEPVVDQMLELASVRPGDVVYDLGSGDGRVLIRAVQKYGARGVGIEIDPMLVEISQQVAREGAVADGITFIEGDLFSADISTATVVVLSLSPEVNARLEPKLRRELRPGTRVVSHRFPIGSWTPSPTARTATGAELFLWVVPEHR